MVLEKGGEDQVDRSCKKKKRKRKKEILQRVKEERSIARKIKRRKANWIGHILLRNCLLKQ